MKKPEQKASRSQKQRQRLVKAGGARVDALLSKEGAEAMRICREKWGCESNGATLDAAVIKCAARIRPRSANKTE